MSNKTVIYLVRHGQTEWNAKKIIQGQKDSPLTDLGITQAKELAKQLKKIKFDIAFSSDLLRARQTAEIIAAEHKLAVETTKLLRERSFGELEGQPIHALKAVEDLFETLEHDQVYKYKANPDFESDEEIATRLLTFLREIAIVNKGKKILVVTHGGIMRVMLIRFGVANYKEPVWFINGGYIKLESDGVEFLIKEINGTEKSFTKH